MHTRLLCNLTLLISMIDAAAIHAVNAQSITVYDFVGIDKNLLDGTEFSTYQKISIPTVGSGYVNRGTCSNLKFTAYITPTGSLAKHTFTVKLKKDGTDIQTAEKKLGPFFVSRTVFVDFQAVDFAPGTWSIDWHWLTNAATTGSGSIKLVSPALAAFAQTLPPSSSIGSAELNQVYCTRGGSPISVAFANNLCEYRTKPPTGFIYNNSYYRTATITSSTCPFGKLDATGLCHVADAPREAVVLGDKFYFEPFGGGLFGSGYCEPQIPAVPAGSGNYSVTNESPFGCRVNVPPYWWQSPVVIDWSFSFTQGTSKLYLTPRKSGSCVEGSFDGANCLIASPPAGTTARSVGSKWYWTPRYCN